MTTELIANSPTPGQAAPLGTLAGACALAATTLNTGFTIPPALQGTSGDQFRVVIDTEIMIIDASVHASPWTILSRGAEGSTKAVHTPGAGVYHDLTAGALQNLPISVDQLPGSVVIATANPAATGYVLKSTSTGSNEGAWEEDSGGGLPSGTTAQTIVYDDTGTPKAAAAPSISLPAFNAAGTADWSTAIQNWMDAVYNGGSSQIGSAPVGAYPYSSQVGFTTGNTTANLKFEMPAGADLQYTGAGSSPAFCLETFSGIIEGGNFTFTNNSYAGDLVNVDWGASEGDCQVHFHNVNFGVQGVHPRSVLRLNHTINSTIKESHFFGGTYGIVAADGDYLISTSIRDSTFNNAVDAHIYFNGGDTESIVIDGNSFEPLSSGEGGAILSGGAIVYGLTITNNWFGDTTVDGGNGQINVSIGSGGTIAGNRFYGSGGVPIVTTNGGHALLYSNDFLNTNGDANGNIINANDITRCILINNSITPPTAGFSIPIFSLGNYNTTGTIGPAMQGAMLYAGVQTTATAAATGYDLSNTGALVIGFGTLQPNEVPARIMSYQGGLELAPSTGGQGNLHYDDGSTVSQALTWGVSGLHGSGPAIGFFGNCTLRQGASGDTTYTASGSVAVTTAGTFTGGVGTTGYTIGSIVAALKNYGLLES